MILHLKMVGERGDVRETGVLTLYHGMETRVSYATINKTKKQISSSLSNSSEKSEFSF